MKRSAFTLMELLVVIAVVALLAAILLVAVNGARETARRNQCLTRQRDLALAMVTYHTENNGLPGSLNQFGNAPIHSWVVSILPMIGENKRYDFLTKDAPVAAEISQAIIPLPAVMCPSDDPQGIAKLNFFVNCGPDDYSPNGNSNLDFVLYRDRRSSLVSLNAKVKLDEIPDGATNTVLLLENINPKLPRGMWHDGTAQPWTAAAYNVNEYPVGTSTPPTFTRNTTVVQHLGFVWGGTATLPMSVHVSSGNAAFADGSAKPISSDISALEYLRLVCPNDVKAKESIANGGLGLTGL